MCDDDWVNLAVADDSLVVNLLLRLHHTPPPPPLSLHLHWTVRQRRSRSVRRHAATAAHKKPESTRASPTTPLSWSGATSASGGNLDGYEESSLPSNLPQTSRSTFFFESRMDENAIHEVANPSETATTRKSRRKKTLAELKEEEDLLLKERRSLKKELASLRLIVEKHRTSNESLKRMKLDFVSRKNSCAAATASDVCGKAVNGPSQFATSECHPSNSVSRSTVTYDVSPVYAANASPKAQENGNQDTFVLPDLNLPVDEDFSANTMH